MARRYAYWRKPNGEVFRGHDERYAHETLLAGIGKASSVNEDGTVSWNSFTVPSIENVIKGSIAIVGPNDVELGQYDTKGIVGRAILAEIREVGGECAITPTALLRRCDKLAASFFRKTETTYDLVTSLSIRSPTWRSISIDGCRVSTLRNRKAYGVPKSIRPAASSGTPHPETHQVVRVRCLGRSEGDAATRALDALTLLTGLWNLYDSYNTWSYRSRSSIRHPLGVAQIGPIHTLHFVDKRLVDDMHWFEIEYAEPHVLFAPRNSWQEIERKRRRASMRLRSLRYGSQLRLLLLRYAGALSRSDGNLAFLEMWSLLESITKSVQLGYDETIDRTTWIYHDRAQAREALRYLRTYRNRYVHAAQSDDDRDDIARIIKPFVDQHLMNLIDNSFGVQSIDEYAGILSLPHSAEKLKTQGQRISRALRYRSC